MPVVPAKWVLSHELQAVLGSQFWSQPIQSSRSADGVATTVQFEPPPLPACSPSGLSRPQFLVAAQASGVPVLPALQGTHGGLVVDRALASVGAQDWWACLLGRCKLQRLLQRKGNSSISEAFWDLDNWGLQAVTRANLGRGLSAKAGLLVESLAIPAGGSHRLPPISGSGQLRQKLHGHEVLLRVGVNEVLVDGSRHTKVPLQASVDVMSAPARRQPFVYRVGVCQTSSAMSSIGMGELSPDSPQAHGAAASAARSPPLQHRMHLPSLQAQAGASVQGERYLWRWTGKEAPLGGSFDADELWEDSPGWSHAGGQQGKGGWSSLVEPPHIKVGGLLGGLANLTHHPSHAAGSSLPWLSTVRGFASAAASVQVGQLRHNLLDFTRASARLDLGLASPPLLPLRPSLRASSDSGFRTPLETAAGPWHSLTLSASQQLFGPVRLNLDTRFALDYAPAHSGPPGRHNRQEDVLQKVLHHASSIRPHQLDSVWSLDTVVPGSQGLARVVAWYSPMKKEAMLEVRML